MPHSDLKQSNLKFQSYTENRKKHWDQISTQTQLTSIFSQYYHKHLNQVYQKQIPAGLRLLEIGCGEGDLLAALNPASGVGIDFSEAMIEKAACKYPHLIFQCADAHDLSTINGTFDVIILSDLLNELWDIQMVLKELSTLCTSRTRIFMNFYSRVWQLPFMVSKKLHWSRPMLSQNWLTKGDVTNLLALENFDIIRAWEEFLFPIPIIGVKDFFNRFLIRIWPFYLFACANMLVARPRLQPEISSPKVSVIVPARNEAGNINAIFERVPEMGAGTELVFIEGGSKDDTFAKIEQGIQAHPQRRCILQKQIGVGKGQAVRQGFSIASGDILMILDADLTVPPENLPLFCEALVTGKGDFINGVRLVYPMEKEAMRFFNFLGNKFFSLAFSWLLGQPIKDTLCGTKVLWRKDYEQIASNRSYFGDFDPFGDFDLIFGAARLNLKLVDLPIRYQERTYGETNISRWKHGWLLLRMVIFAASKIKFS